MYLSFICIFIVSLILIKLVKIYAPKLGLMDVPNERSAHCSIIPRGAGIGFYLPVAFILPIFHFDLISAYQSTALAILFVFIVGVLDDHRDASPNTKFLILMPLQCYFPLTTSLSPI